MIPLSHTHSPSLFSPVDFHQFLGRQFAEWELRMESSGLSHSSARVINPVLVYVEVPTQACRSIGGQFSPISGELMNAFEIDGRSAPTSTLSR